MGRNRYKIYEPTHPYFITIVGDTGYCSAQAIKQAKENNITPFVPIDQYVQRLDHMATLIEEIRFTNLDERLLHWLQDQPSKDITLSHEEIGEILGCSREVVSRILKGLEKNGMVTMSRRLIRLL